MSEIKVGDRVHVSAEYDGIVCVLDGDEAWVEDDDGIHCTHVLSELTRLDPEPVTLRAKYKAEERVRARNGDEVTIAHPFIAYRTNYNFTYAEDQLEPIPTPCPTCKGSGKSEGSA